MSDLRVTILKAGYCICPEHLAIQGGAWRTIPFPAMFALIEHPRFGPLLFDTGYARQFFVETRAFPASIYRMLAPVTLDEDQLATHQLAKLNIRPSDITHIFISHFHADHIAALSDFERARYVYLPSAYEAVRRTRGLKAVARSFLPGLIPANFDERAKPVDTNNAIALPPEYGPFSRGFDVLGDGALLAIELPGHATGQMGLFVRAAADRTYFFVADAAWLARAVNENLAPHTLANLLFSDPRAYKTTLGDLNSYHSQHPNVHLIPSHCSETLKRYAHAG